MSTLNHSRSIVSGMLSEMHSTRKPRINVYDMQKLNNEGFARVTASVTHTHESRENHQMVLDALSEKLGRKVRPVEGSFRSISSSTVGENITGIVSSNPDVISFDPEDTHYHAVAGNMFMDDEENMWALRKTESGDLLVKSRGKEDADIIGDLMSSLSSSGVGTMAFEANASSQREADMRNSLQGGDYVAFVNPASESVEFGAVVASVFNADNSDTGNLIIQSSDLSKNAVTVDRNMTLAAFEVDVDDTGLVSESSNVNTLEFITSYYRKLFQRDPSYFEKFMERWNNHKFG